MKRIAWLTDIHLNFLDRAALRDFLAQVAQEQPDGLFITGDIGESPNVEVYLKLLERVLACPIYFVLGNHDFYRGSIAEVRRRMAALTEASTFLRWMPAAGVVELTPGVGVVGHDGWADGRAGDYLGSSVQLNDYRLIEELIGLAPADRLARVQAMGDEAALSLRETVPAALERYEHVYVLIHTPPFAEACWYQGRLSGPHWVPHLTCVAAGEVLLRFMRDRPDRQMTVLCGHTHGGGTAKPLPNLHVFTGEAEYRAPVVQRVLTLD